MEVFRHLVLTSSISALTSITECGARLTSTRGVAEAFNTRPVAGGWWCFCAFLFGYTTLIGWSYYGEVCLEYILGPGGGALPMVYCPRRPRARARWTSLGGATS